MRRNNKKLSLHKNTIRHLDNDPLHYVAGGGKKKDTVWDDGCGMHTTICPDRSALGCLTKNDNTLCKPISYQA